MLHPWSLAVLLVAIGGAGWNIWTGRTPDLLTGAGLLLGISLSAAQGWMALGSHTAALLLAAGALLLAYQIGSVGGDVVRLAACLGALGGLPFSLALLPLALLYGSLLGVATRRVLEQPAPRAAVARVQGWLRSAHQERAPHGLTLALAALTLLLVGYR